MAIKERYFGFALSVLLWLQAAPGWGQAAQPTGSKEEKEINITAESLSVGDSGAQVEAKGKVEIRRGDTLLKADEVRLNRTTQDVEAKGKVSVDDPRGTLKADAVRMNLQNETGEIENGDLFYGLNHLSLTGRKFQRLGGQTYHIADGTFTTCLCESGSPTWKIGAEQIDLTEEGTGVIRGGTFYLFDIPILYLPYASFPLRTDRESGFLFPRIGSSSKEGFRFEQPFFLAMSKSSDATVGFDLATRARVGLLGEFRTILNQNTSGQIDVSYFNEGLRKNAEDSIADRTIADPNIPRDRWSVLATHRHTNPLGWKTYSDIAAFSDDLFLREIDLKDAHSFNLDPLGRERDLRTRRYGRSRFGIQRDWGDVRVQGEWAYYQDFIQDDDFTLQKTPQLLVKGRHVLGESPLELRWHASGVNYVRKEGADGLRFDLRPELIMPFRVAPHLLGSFGVALRETAYHLYRDEGSFDRNRSRELVEVRGSLGTSVARVFSPDGDYLKKIKHVMDPEVSYLFIPRVKDRDIPVFDGTDRINRRNLLILSLTNRLWGKFAQEPVAINVDKDVELVAAPTLGDIREMGRLRLALSYDIDRERKGGDSLSDLDMNLRVNPLDALNLGIDAGVNPGPWQMTQAAALVTVFDPRPITHRVLDRDFMKPNQVSFSFRFMRRNSLS